MIIQAEDLATSAAHLLGAELADWQVAGGGDLNLVVRLRLTDGTEAVAKAASDPRAEAAMLTAIRAAEVPAPAVRAVNADLLVLEAMEDSGGLSAEGWRELGAALRRLHTVPGIAYGWDRDYAFGKVVIHNAPCDTWPAFWAERRLLSETSALPSGLARRLERLARDLPNRLPVSPPPVLLHGDLWSGNVLATDGHLSALIDPACYCGDGEVDLAMLALFGSPGAAFAEGYGPLPLGAAERQPIYQLWPAIVHLRLFGGGYAGPLDRLLKQAGV